MAEGAEALEMDLSFAWPPATDELVARLAGLERRLVWIDLSRSQVSDKGLRPLAGFTQLRRLRLARTSIGDEGVKALLEMNQLEQLELHGTEVTDAGLDVLRELPALRTLGLWQTHVTPEGLARLRIARPALHIRHDGGPRLPQRGESGAAR